MKAILFALAITCALCAKTADFTPVLDSVLSILNPYFEFGSNVMEIVGDLLGEYSSYKGIKCRDEDYCIHDILDELIDLIVDNRNSIEDGIEIYKEYKSKKLQEFVDELLSEISAPEDEEYEPIDFDFDYNDMFSSDEIADMKKSIDEFVDEIISSNSDNKVIKKYLKEIRDEAFKAIDAVTSNIEDKVKELEKNINKAVKAFYNGGTPKLNVGKLESIIKNFAKSVSESLEEFYEKYDKLSKRDGQHTAEERKLMAETSSQIAKDSAKFIEKLADVSGASINTNKLLVTAIAVYLLAQ